MIKCAGVLSARQITRLSKRLKVELFLIFNTGLTLLPYFCSVEQLTDPELLALIQENDEQAFAVVARRYERQLFRLLYNKLGSMEDAADILQNLYVSLWKNRLTLVITDSFLPYLYRSAQYAVVNEYLFRRRKADMAAFFAQIDEPSVPPAEEHLAAEDLRKEFEAELLKMPATIQQVFRLSREEGLSVKEIALQLQINEQTVRNYLSSALQVLRRRLSRMDTSLVLAVASACLFERLNG